MSKDAELTVNEAAELLGLPVELLLEHLPAGSTEDSRMDAAEVRKHAESARRTNERSAEELEHLMGLVDDEG